MKKTLITIIGLSLFVMGFCGNHDLEEDNQFGKYQKEQTFENFSNASKHYSNLLDVETSDNDSRIMLSYLYLMELHNTLSYFEENIDSLNNRAKFSYANILLEMKDYTKAIKIYDIINNDTPKWSCPWRHKGEALMKANELEKAELATMKSIEVKKDHYDAYIQLARIQKMLGKNEIALTTIENGIALMDINDEEEVTDKVVFTLYAEILRLNDKIDEAKEIENKLK